MTAEVNGLNEKIIAALKKANMKISTAESCTGGLISALLTDVSGASDVLDECIVTYSNGAKMRELGVKSETLEAHGAVSAETAAEMCRGICEHTGADVGIGVTGIAGPTGGTPQKPVGTVFTGIYINGRTVISEHHFGGNREKVREETCSAVFSALLKELNDACKNCPSVV